MYRLAENPINYKELFPCEWLNDDNIGSFIRKQIKGAKRTFKRSDRVFWYLRFLRIAIARDEEMYEIFVTKYNKKTKGTKIPESDTIHLGINDVRVMHVYPSGAGIRFVLERDLEHYLALDLPKINDYVFDWQLPHELFSDLKALEDDYLETIGSYIPFDQAEDYPVLIDFKDGYVWFNTEEQSARDQTFAMTGHCSTCYNYDEIALVLREHVVVDGQDFWRPVLQFCVDPNGMLGEMKGKANNKPSSKYFKYIVPLLRHKIVKGIKGGGHKPHTNFALSDLPDKDRKKLQKAKPALLTLKDYVEIYGLDKKAIRRIQATIEKPLIYDKKTHTWLIELDIYTTLYELLKDIGNDTVQWLADVVDDKVLIDVYEYDIDSTQWFYLINDEVRARLAKFKEEDAEDYEEVLRFAGMHALESGAYDRAHEVLFDGIEDAVCTIEVYLSDSDAIDEVEDIPTIINAKYIDEPATIYVRLIDLINAGYTYGGSIESYELQLGLDANLDLDSFSAEVFEERLIEELDERDL